MASIDQSNLKNQIHTIMFLKNESSRPLFKPGFGFAEVFMRIQNPDPVSQKCHYGSGCGS